LEYSSILKSLLFSLPSTTPALKTYAIVDSLRDESVKEMIPLSGLDHLDLWHEDLWAFEHEVPVYLVELKQDNEFTEYLLQNRDKDLAVYLISPYRLEVLQRYYSFFTYPDMDGGVVEFYGRKKQPPEGKEWSSKAYFGFYCADMLSDYIDTLYSEEKIDEFFAGAAMWLVPDSEGEGLYIAFRDKAGVVDDVVLDLSQLTKAPNPMLDFERVSFPTIPNLEEYAHEVSIDLKQIQHLEKRHIRKFIDNVFFWAKRAGFRFRGQEERNRQRAYDLFEQANTLGLESEMAVYRYIVYALLISTPIEDTPVYERLKEIPDEKTKVQLLTQETWKIVQSQRRAGGSTKTA